MWKNYTYGEKLVKSGLISLEKRCFRGDLIEIKRRVRGNLCEMFQMSKNYNLFNIVLKLGMPELLRGKTTLAVF